MHNFKLLIALIVALGLVACDKSDKKSSLSIAVKDAPVDDAKSVFVTFSGLELKPQSGSSFDIDLDEPQTIDLLAFQGTDAAQLFENITIDAGEYNWMRLKVNALQQTMDSYIVFNDDSSYSLYVPSGAQTGLQLNQGFTAPANGSVDFTIDFDLRKSIHSPGNSSDDYFLRPSLRIVDNTVVGHIEGVIANSVFEGATCSEARAVYLFASDAMLNDYGSESEPQTSAAVTMNENQEWVYTLGYVLPGNYQLAVTCESDQDDPEIDDDITFVAEANVEVTENNTTVFNFD